jgi:hypothetical protein
MSHQLDPLLDEIKELERLVSEKIQQAKAKLTFEIKHGKPVFDLPTRRYHKSLAKATWRYLCESSLLAILTTPIIYSLLLPIAVLDMLLWIYQATCFPIYHIPRVRRADYVAIDRHHLAYLNVVERMNCVYCGYANGVLAYAREIASRTEQYWCPIKHARRVLGCHARQCLFCEYGDADGFRRNVDDLRKRFDDLSN